MAVEDTEASLSTPPLHTTLVTRVSEQEAADLWPVYDPVFADQPDEGTWRDSVWDRHSARGGFRLVRAPVSQGT